MHSLGVTHSFLSSSITVPFGHSHPLVIQTAGQATDPVVLHVWWQPGCEAHSFLTCPLTGQAAIKIIYDRYKITLILICELRQSWD